MNELVAGLDGSSAPFTGQALGWLRRGWFAIAFATAYLLMLSGALYSLFVSPEQSREVVEKAGSSSTYMALWLALYAVLIFQLRHELIKPVNLFAQNRLFGLFLFAALLSYAFSPPATQLVVTKLFMFVMTLLFGLFMARTFTIERLLSMFVTLSVFVLVVHWAIYPVQSHFAYDHMDRTTLLGMQPYGGLFAHKNLAGTFFGLSFMACYGRAQVEPHRLTYAILAIGHAVTLVLAGAAGALLCAALGAAVMTGFDLHTRRSKLMPLFLLAVATGVLAVIGLGTSSVLEIVGRDAGMSGRWRVFAVWPSYFWQHPLFGWGYSNFFTGVWNEPAEALQTLTPYHAKFYTFESGYFELLIDFGLIGAGLFFAMMATGLRNAAALAMRSGGRFAQVPLGWVVFIAVMSISDSGLRIHNLITAALVAWTYFGLRSRNGATPAAIEPMLTVQPRRSMWTPS